MGASVVGFGAFRRTGMRRFSSAIVMLVLTAVTALPTSAQTPAKPVNFEADVQPILVTKCTGCHGPDTRINEMNLISLAGIMKGSAAGAVIGPRNPAASRLQQ